MPTTNGAKTNGTRAIALVGPAGAGKTSLAEALLFAAGATDRHGSVANGSSIGDSSPEARSRGGSTELNLYNFDYLGDHFAIVDAVKRRRVDDPIRLVLAKDARDTDTVGHVDVAVRERDCAVTESPHQILAKLA